MQNFLSIDCSSNYLSVAVKANDGVYRFHELAPKRHNELLLPTIKGLLTQAGIGVTDLDVILVGRGPGSFVGVRLAIGVVQGLAFGLNIPVIPLSSMQLIAQSVIDRADSVLVVIDARMGDVYLGQFERQSDIMLPVREWVEKSNAIDLNETDCFIVKEEQAIADASLSFDLISWAQQQDLPQPASQVQPIYLRGTQNWQKA